MQRASLAAHHERGDVMNNGKSYDTLGIKFVETLADVTYEAQEKTAELRKAYLKTMQESQKTTFELAFAWFKQMQELQTLSFDYLQDLARANYETLSKFSQVQDEIRHDVKEGFDHQVSKVEKAGAAAK
jgi:hypothetical protein